MTLVPRLLLASLRPPALALLTMAALVAIPAFAATPLVVVANTSPPGSVTYYAAGDQGDVAPAKKIVGAATGLNQPTCSFVYGAELYVVNRDSVTVYPFGASGDVPPTRTISGASTELHSPHHCFVDRGELFVANADGGAVTVYDAHDSGNVAPKRKLSVGGTRGVAVSGDELFVAQDAGSVVWVYSRTATDPATPTRTISGASTQLASIVGVATGGGELYVASASGAVFVFNLTDHDDVAPKRVLAGSSTGFTAPVAAWVSAGELFVVDYWTNSLRVFNADDDGNVLPKRVIGGGSTGINLPFFASVNPDPGIVALWPADGNANDVVGGHNGTLQGGAGFASGRVGQAFSFTGADQVLVPDSDSLNITTAITITAWIKPSPCPQDYCAIVAKSAPYTTGRSYGMWLTGPGNCCAGPGAIHVEGSALAVYALTAGATVPNNAWTHVAAVIISGGDIKIYVNGQLQPVSSSGTPTLVASATPLSIGYSDPGSPWFYAGLIDEIEIFNRALSAEEVAAKYAAEPSPPVLASAASRKVHGAAGTFDLPLSLVSTNPTTEPRQGPVHTIVFTFDRPVTAGVATVTEGTATAGAPTFDGNEMRVPLSGVVNQQYVTVAVSDANAADGGSGGSGSIRVGFLLGDVNQNRVVSLSDLGQVNAQIAQFVTSANFLKDVNASGTLSLADKGITNTQVTRALPAP